MRIRTIAILVVVALVLSANPAPAAIINAGFETGDFTGWSTIGLTSVVTGASLGIMPVEGQFQALVSNLDGFSSVPVGQLETFLGLEGGSLNTLLGASVTQGSAIKQTFSVNPGDRIQFAWNFLTNEATPSFFNDTAFAIISPSFIKLADTNSTFHPGVAGFGEQTGYHTFLSDPLTGGSVTLAFGVVDVGNRAVDSTLLVDAVPEPSTLLLLGTSLAGIGMSSLRRYRQRRD
jgi:PEP-CTERM motif-containing protein